MKLIDILDKLTEIEFITAFLGANTLNVIVVFAFIYLFARMAIKTVVKPQEKQNEILKGLFEKIGNLVDNINTNTKVSDDRDEKYVNMINQISNDVDNSFEIVRSDLKEINNTLIEHNSYRCRDAINKVVKLNEKDK